METNVEYVSLFDYLGQPAGSRLGKEVYTFAKSLNVKVRSKTISTPRYTGEVILYPKTFLVSYFNTQQEKLPF